MVTSVGQMRWLAWIAIGLMHAACSGSSSTPDAQMVDASSGALIVELVAKGGVPQTTEDGVDINTVLFGAKLLRVIGDAAPGDMRTTRTEIEFAWSDSPTGPTIPIPHRFNEAPPGMYSTLELRLGDSDKLTAAVNILGRVSRGGNVVPFEILNLALDIPISVTVSMTLPPRALETLSIELDVPALIDDIDWDAVPLTGEGNLFLGDGDPQMAKVTAEIANAFREFERP